MIRSGPPNPDLPYRWGCPCGGTWNSDEPELKLRAYCGPFCNGSQFFQLDNYDDLPDNTTTSSREGVARGTDEEDDG